MKVHEIITTLANTPSRKKKEEILKDNQGNSTLRLAFKLAYDSTINFWITSAKPLGTKGSGEKNLFVALTRLQEYVSTRVYTGDAAQMFVNDLYTDLCPEDRVVFQAVLRRNLDCGVGESTINMVWPGLIPTFGVMLASTDISKIVYPAYVQTKYDGARAVLTVQKGGSTLRSRGGNTFRDVIIHSMEYIFPEDTMLDGELLFLDDQGTPLPRKTSNGLANRSIKGSLPQEYQHGSAFFFFWDMVDSTGTQPYSTRLSIMKTLWVNRMITVRAALAPTHIVHNYDEVVKAYNYARKNNEEGIIIKNMDLKWQEARVPGMVKMKELKTADLLVTGILPGEGKYTGMIGALQCESACGKLKVNVGTGLTDKDRTAGSIVVGDVVEVGYNEIITRKNTDTKSLFLPVYFGLRLDKARAANTLDELT